VKSCIRLLLLLLPLVAAAQSSLPPCPVSGYKHNCSGTQSYPNGAYVGEFKDGKFNGQGTYTHSSGNKYVGEFKDGMRHGQATFTFASGDKYVGEYKDDKRSGRGTFTFADGGKYVGEYKDGKQNGQGIEYYSNGTISASGQWVDGKLVQSFALDQSRFPFNAPTQTASVQPTSVDGNRLAAEAQAARQRQQALEQRLAAQAAEAEAAKRRQQELEAQLAAAQLASQTASRPTTSKNERRVALVIGNAAYKSSPLTNPVNDASDVTATLRSMGFETILVRDATLAQMRSATRDFAEAAASSEVALIFFAGHGIEARGRNFVIPVNADIKHEYELEEQAYDASRWLEMLEGLKTRNRQRVNIVILDACRNNEFARSWRSSSRGLARMDAPTGTFVAFSTAPGKVALDGAKGQRNSPFTKNLLRAIQTPDVPIELMFKEVRRLVVEETKSEQVPWENSSLVGDFVFKRTR
jgi:hypothetical protein